MTSTGSPLPLPASDAGRQPARLRHLASRYDVFLVAGLSLLAGLAVIQAWPPLIAVPAMAALVLVLPGYAIVRALFAHELHDAAERALLAVGLSLCTTILGGFLLNVLPDGLSAVAWGSWLTAVALIGSAIAALRNLRSGSSSVAATGAAAAGDDAAGGADPGVAIPAGEHSRRAFAPIPRFQVGLLLAAGVLVVASLLLSRFGVAQQAHPGFTQLWLLPESGGSVTMGITNHEGTAVTYRLVLRVDGAVAHEWTAVPLRDSQTWQQPFAVPAGSAALQLVDASLYRGGDATPYRETHVMMQGGQPAAASAAPSATK